ncbi:unnamed protein product [Acanthoscelides obtectus]|uniref:Uncharacterized protein n=1 Tax=Acanthoscelides obtectus TaxID=200917 RepID=A0A9P0JKX1_ACAOB|nr:unnamed protein product [Acanthoscelides obtectus]CAK1657893.1 hypothetical protein AOBTE_LOCUS20590 [Acanthoscelides obtectus]
MRIESALGVYNITITSARGIYRMIHRRCRQIAVLLIGNDCCVRRYDRPSVATRSDRIGWTTCERRILCSGGWYSFQPHKDLPEKSHKNLTRNGVQLTFFFFNSVCTSQHEGQMWFSKSNSIARTGVR